MSVADAWVCRNCRSLNAASSSACYRCRQARIVEAADPEIRADDLPQPCWCDRIKGDHDVRDHLSDLSMASSNWTALAVLRQYKNDDEGQAAFA